MGSNYFENDYFELDWEKAKSQKVTKLKYLQKEQYTSTYNLKKYTPEKDGNRCTKTYVGVLLT